MADVNPITVTTLSTAIADATSKPPTSGTWVTPASMTNIQAPGPNKSNRTILWIDREALEVTQITTTQALCNRGVWGTLQKSHAAGTIIWIGTEQDFTYFNQNEQGNAGLGLYSQMTVNFETINVTTAAGSTGTTTLTAVQLLGGLLEATPTGSLNYATPTATLLLAAMGGFCNPYINQSFEFTIINNAAGADTITLTAGTGATLTGTMTIAQNNGKRFRVVITNVVAPAYTVYSLGTFTF